MDCTYPDLIILGSTGSVGTQAADVAAAHGIRVQGLSAKSNAAVVEEQARRFNPEFCVMEDEEAARDLRVRLLDTSVKVLCGTEGMIHMLNTVETDNPQGLVVENSILGEAGLIPTIETLKAGWNVALANKESLVVGGEVVMPLAREKGLRILPVDSEHCAIFQCLRAGRLSEIRQIWLTASGGPFYGYDKEKLQSVTLEDTLKHPTWQMGAKITVDSATLMNKGFEVIEAVHLFGVRPDQIQVVVHRESMIHSMVEYIDHSIIAQMSVPDMRHCVQYALTHPVRRAAGDTVAPLNLFEVGKLTFARPDTETFPLLSLAVSCIEAGGALPAVLNAANEEAVAAFLNGKLPFYRIAEAVSTVVERSAYASHVHGLEGILECDRAARLEAKSVLGCMSLT